MSAGSLPLTVIGGYLGAGKTTLVNRILTEAGGARIAVLVNDFGAVNVDAELIESKGASTMSLANGCVCCSFADGLAMALLDVRDNAESFDHVVIEVSGVGDPWKVAQWGRTPGFTLDGVIVLAAADSVVAKADDALVGETVRRQLAGADVVLLTRTDVADPAGAQRWLAANVDAPVVVGPTADAPIEAILGFQRRDAMAEPPAGAEHHRFATWVVEPRATTADELRALLEDAPEEVWRAKGIVGTADGAHLVQKVGRRTDLAPADVAATLTGLVVIAERSTPAVERWLSAIGRR